MRVDRGVPLRVRLARPYCIEKIGANAIKAMKDQQRYLHRRLSYVLRTMANRSKMEFSTIPAMLKIRPS